MKFTGALLLRCIVVQMYTHSQYYTSLFEIIFKKSENLTKTPRLLRSQGETKRNERGKGRLFVHKRNGTGFGGVFVGVSLTHQIIPNAIKQTLKK